MFKIYRQVSHTSNLESSQEDVATKSTWIGNLFALPIVIAGALLGTFIFSVFFAVLLIPAGILGFRAWRMTKQAPKPHNTIEGEYKVISDD